MTNLGFKSRPMIKSEGRTFKWLQLKFNGNVVECRGKRIPYSTDSRKKLVTKFNHWTVWYRHTFLTNCFFPDLALAS